MDKDVVYKMNILRTNVKDAKGDVVWCPGTGNVGFNVFEDAKGDVTYFQVKSIL